MHHFYPQFFFGTFLDFFKSLPPLVSFTQYKQLASKFLATTNLHPKTANYPPVNKHSWLENPHLE